MTRSVFGRSGDELRAADQGRDAAAAHRAREHPQAVQTRRRRAHLQRWNVSDDSWRSEGLENAAEVAAMHAAREARQSAA